MSQNGFPGPRFNFFGDCDGEILKHADQIEIKLVKIADSFGIEFRICGGHFPEPTDNERLDSAELAEDLLRRFVAAKGGAA